MTGGFIMNQIINIDLNKHIDTSENLNNSETLNITNKKSSHKKFSKKIFTIQFLLSIVAILVISSLFIYSKISLNNKESFSNLLVNNYSITKLYSNDNNDTTNENIPLKPDSVIGIIEIPTLNISYPIFNELNDELLKTSPCRFYGDFPTAYKNSANTNLCIAGHNYDNDKFFSNIKDLKLDDKIFLYNTSNHTYIYSVIKNYEVKSNDLSPVYETITDSFELTLVTCNNFNGNRIIIKAKIEDV